MAAEEPNDERRARWWIRLRRAFEIPDLVTDANAREVIAHRLAAKHPMNTPQLGEDVEIAKELVDLFLVVCSRGSADVALVAKDETAWVRNEPDPRRAVSGDVLAAHRIESTRSIDAINGMVDRLFGVIEKSVEHRPFGDATGRYF
jgi:hypothetical protein